MKLAYNNWHKEQAHDDAIQSELTNITEGQLTFTNTPYVKAFRLQEGRERGGYGGGGNNNGKQRGKFQHRNNGGGGNNNNNNRRNDNRGGGSGGQNFKKKRY